MSRFALKEETGAFAARVVELIAPRFRSGWRGRVERLWVDVQARGLAERTDATRKLYASRFRAAVRDAVAQAEPDQGRRERVEDALMDIVRIDRAVLLRLQDAYVAKVRAGNASLVLVPGWGSIVQALRLMLDGDEESRALGLMGLTGRRFAEVLKAGSFAPSVERVAGGPVRQRWLLDFTGQLKTGGGPNTMSGRTFRVPTLAPAIEVLDGFQALRASPNGRTWAEASDRQLSTTVNPEFNRRLLASPVARVWPEGAPLTTKELRALYAEVAYVNFAPRTTRAPYYARILGHREDDLNTALSYMRFSLSEAALREGQEEMNRLTLLREERRDAARAVRAEAGKGGKGKSRSRRGKQDAMETVGS